MKHASIIDVKFCLTGEGGCLLRSTLSGQSLLCTARALAGLPKVLATSTHILSTHPFIFVQSMYQKYLQPQLHSPHIHEQAVLSRKTFWKTFSRLGDALDVRLWPYGKATTRKLRLNIELSSCVKLFLIVFSGGGFEFQCQHGEEECEGNIWHACTSRSVIKRQRILEKQKFKQNVHWLSVCCIFVCLFVAWAEMQKAADTADILVLSFLRCANFWTMHI